MSYILEALRKADADRERERGGIPTIHSPGPSTPALADDDLDGDDDIRRRRPAPRLLVGAVVGLGLTVISLIGWLWLGPSSDRGAPTVAEAAPPRLDHAPPPPAAPNPPPVLQAAPPMPSPGWDAAVPRAAPAPSQQPVARAVPKEARSDAAPAPAAASAVARVPTLDELPDDVRRQLPVLAVNGSKYADAPASRILILNGQIFHEGDRITPDLTLEHIRLKEAELRYRGQRYLIKF